MTGPRSMNQSLSRNMGKVYLVGAGPGDPRLITLRGIECLQRADLVFYDCLVNPAILRYVVPSAEVVYLASDGSHSAPSKAFAGQIMARMVDAAGQGKTVVYLKGGDPEVFGHNAGQTEALAAAGIPFETVPGVTAALAAAGYAGIPITHGRCASAVALVTARQPRDKSDSPVDYGALASFPGTLIFYMGLETAGQWSRALTARGRPPETPVAIVGRCSWPDQQTIRCTLGTLAGVVAEREVRRPTVIIVGEVVSLAPEVSWFAARPLFGKRILLTRPQDQAGPLYERFTELGAEVLLQPAIRIGDPPDWAPVDAALDELDRYQWLVFSSANGVRYLLERLLGGGRDLRRLGQVKLAAIGPATADELRRYHLRADLVPGEYRAEALAEALVGRCGGSSPDPCSSSGTAADSVSRDVLPSPRSRRAPRSGRGQGVRGSATGSKPRLLLARASRGREVLAERLTAAGAAVDQIVVYSSTDVERADEDVAAAMAAGRIDWVTVTSSAIARSLVALFGDRLRRCKLASISPITSEALRQLGHEPAAEATEYTTEGLVAAILAEG
jgi:uroporphyrinogen III methyltransferase/synthase